MTELAFVVTFAGEQVIGAWASAQAALRQRDKHRAQEFYRIMSSPWRNREYTLEELLPVADDYARAIVVQEWQDGERMDWNAEWPDYHDKVVAFGVRVP